MMAKRKLSLHMVQLVSNQMKARNMRSTVRRSGQPIILVRMIEVLMFSVFFVESREALKVFELKLPLLLSLEKM